MLEDRRRSGRDDKDGLSGVGADVFACCNKDAVVLCIVEGSVRPDMMSRCLLSKALISNPGDNNQSGTPPVPKGPMGTGGFNKHKSSDKRNCRSSMEHSEQRS